MSQTEKFRGNRYEIIAWANDQRVLIYQEFGSYQGEWVLLALDDDKYSIYKGSYGSCSGCDSYEAEFDYSQEDITKDRAGKFAHDYHAFVEIPRATMRNLLRSGNLPKVFPKNVRDDYSEFPMEDVIADTTLAAKLEEKEEIKITDILNAKNQELKQRALKEYGYERFVKDADTTVLDTEGNNQLLKCGGVLFAYVKDSSTERKYLLRVPPNMVRIRQALAWTFNMNEKEYAPLIET